MIEKAGIVRSGARTFIGTEYTKIGIAVGVIAFLISMLFIPVIIVQTVVLFIQKNSVLLLHQLQVFISQKKFFRSLKIKVLTSVTLHFMLV